MIRRGIGVQSFVSAGGAAPVDADAQAFIDAAGITDATQQSAINTLVTDLKGYGIWSKMKAIYPFVGGTSSTHKWNLKDPRDLDAAFRLVFSGGWTHSSTGALPNGTNGYANTFLKPSNFSQNNISGGSYVNTNATFGSNLNRTDVLFGASNSSFVNGFYLLPISGIDSKDYSRCNQDSASGVLSWTDPKGFFQIYRTISTDYVVKRNTTNSNRTVNSSTPSSNNIWIAALNNNGSMVEASNNRIAFIYFADGLTDTEAANLYTAVQAYQTSLSRNV